MNKKSFEFNSLMLFILMMIANIGNYLFQIIMAKLLVNVQDYGEMNTLLSMLAIFTVPGTVITLVAAKYTSSYLILDKSSQLKKILGKLLKITIVIAVFMILIGIFFSEILTALFQIESKEYIFLILFIASLLLFSSVFIGILQGLKSFVKYGIQNIINIACKFIVGCLLVYLGWGIWGVLFGLLTGSIVILIFTFYSTRQTINLKLFKSRYKDSSLFPYMMGTFFIQGCLSLLMNCDMLLVKIFFDNKVAGIYSSAMVIGKIGMYVSGAIVTALFPMVSENFSNKKDISPLLLRSMLYGGGISVACALGMIFCGNFIVNLLFGTKYIDALRYLPAVCIFVVPLTLLTISTNFITAMGKTKDVSYLLIIGSTIAILVTLLFHNSVFGMLALIGFILTCMFIINIFFIIRENNKLSL